MSGMINRFIKSPLVGAVGALMSAVWEGFWLVGPPLGLTKSDGRWYLAIGLFTMMLAGGQSFYFLKKRIRVLEEILNSAPRLIARRISDSRTNIDADFYHLRIANDPTGTQRRQTAEKVAGTVEIRDEHGTVVAPIRVHRWAASPFIPGFPEKSDLQLPIDIDANGMEHSLDIAHKWEDESDFFTHNNESVAKYGYKDPNYKFGPGTYVAAIKITGKNTSADFRCKIINRGPHSKLDIAVI